LGEFRHKSVPSSYLLPSQQFKKWKCTEVFMHGKTLNRVIGPALSCTSSGPLIRERPTASGFSHKRMFGYPMLHDLVPMHASFSNNTKLNNPVNISYSSNCRVQTCSGSLIIFSLCGDDSLNESCTFRILSELPLLNWNNPKIFPDHRRTSIEEPCMMKTHEWQAQPFMCSEIVHFECHQATLDVYCTS